MSTDVAQEEIDRRVEETEARLHPVKANVKKLTQSLLAKAFHGELVSPAPTDEPAESLLARIRSAQPVSHKSQRTRK